MVNDSKLLDVDCGSHTSTHTGLITITIATTAYAEGLHHACKGGYLGGTTGKSGKSYKHDTNRNIAPSASRSILEAISDTRRLIMRPDLSWLPY
jgi:hypothetical protein